MIPLKFKSKLESMANGVIGLKAQGHDYKFQDRLNETDIFLHCKGEEYCMAECEEYYLSHKQKAERLIR